MKVNIRNQIVRKYFSNEFELTINRINRTFLLLFILSLIPVFSLSQNMPNEILDQKGGFKDLKIGDPFSKWSNKLTYAGKDDNGEIYYTFNGECCQKLFETQLAAVTLKFKNNKLEVIYLFTPVTQRYSTSTSSWVSDEYLSLKAKFEHIFNQKARESMPKEGDGPISSWYGRKIMLQLTFEYMGLEFDKYNRAIKKERCYIIISKPHDLNSGF